MGRRISTKDATASAITIDTSGLDKTLEGFRKDQLPYAKAVALNMLAKDAIRVEKLSMIWSFDRPTPYVINSLRAAKFATKKDPNTAIWFKGDSRIIGKTVRAGVFGLGPVERLMSPQIAGGARDDTPTEYRLRAVGKQIGKSLTVTPLVGPGEHIVAARSARKNVYGNISQGEYVKMLSYFRAFNDDGFTANRARGAKTNARGERYFVQQVGRSRGIFKVRGRGAARLMWLIVKKKPRYKPRFDFYGIADRHAAKWAGYFGRKGMDKALKTAR